MEIRTVTGAQNPSDLGFTSMHEHVLRGPDWPYTALYRQWLGDIPPERFPCPTDKPISIQDLGYLRHSHHELCNDNTLDEPLMTAELADFYAAGGRAVLECGAPGIRGDIAALKRVSESSNVKVIASTGLYVEQSWPDKCRGMAMRDFVSYMEGEIEYGIDGSGILPGQIKAAINGSATKPFLEFWQAVADVARQSRLCVTAHIEDCSTADHRECLKKAAEFGMPFEKLLLCHFQTHFQQLDLETLVRDPEEFRLKLDYAMEVLDRGASICIDCFGMIYDDEPLGRIAESDSYKIAGLYHLVGRGYEDQIVIGTDIFMKLMTRRFGGHGYVRLLNYVVPTLRSLGIAERVIEKITVINPARLLAI